MKLNSEKSFYLTENPIDEIEETFLAYGLNFHRDGENKICLNYKGIWNNYELFFSWKNNINLIQIKNNLNIKVPSNLVDGVQSLISVINERVDIGHFGFSSEEMNIYFRHDILLRGGGDLTTEEIENFFDLVIEECDKFYPVIQVFIHRKHDVKLALDSVLLETAGEA